MPTLTAEQIAGYARGAGFSGSDVTKAVAIAFAESRGNPKAINRANRNGSVDYGLMQINTVHKQLLASGKWDDPASNMAMARRVFLDAGGKWTPWATYNSGSYLAFMPKAAIATKKPPGNAPTIVQPGQTDMPTPVTTVNAGFSFVDNLPRFVQGIIGGLLVLFALYQMTGSNIIGTAAKLAITKGK